MADFPPIAAIPVRSDAETMVANDNEELPHLRYFLQCYWNEGFPDGSLERAAQAFTREKESFSRGLLADLEVVERRNLLADRWPKPGPMKDFWMDLGADRILSQENVRAIRRVIQAHLG